MASGGKKETPKKGFDWPEKDIEFMIEQLVATGRFEVLPTSINTSVTQDLGARPIVKTPTTPKAEATTDTDDLVSLPSQLPLATSTPDHTSVKAESVQSDFKFPPPTESDTKKTVSQEAPPPPVFKIKTDPAPAHVHFADTGSADNKTKNKSGSDQLGPQPTPAPHTDLNASSFFNNSYLASMRVPQLPPFSGENQKGDVSFEVWKYELHCLIRDAFYPEALILQSIRKSLKGKARDILLTLAQTAKPPDILSKFEGIYGIVSSKEVLLQQFYLETQKPDESVADYSIRIENLLRRATDRKQIEESSRHEMLCSKLWNGLRDPLLKNSSRYKYETETDFNKLRKEIRCIEQDLLTSRHTTEEAKQLQQTTSNNNTEKKLDGILEQMKKMRERMDGLEKKFYEATRASNKTSSSDSSASSSSSVKSTTSRGGGGANYYQPRGGGRGRGGRGFYSRRSNKGQSQQQKHPKTENKPSSNPSNNKEN